MNALSMHWWLFARINSTLARFNCKENDIDLLGSFITEQHSHFAVVLGIQIPYHTLCSDDVSDSREERRRRRRRGDDDEVSGSVEEDVSLSNLMLYLQFRAHVISIQSSFPQPPCL